MPEYRLRLDKVAAFSMVDLDRYLTKYATAYLLVRHEPKKDNVHYHAWISTPNADSTIRLMLTKHMPYLKGNGGHSVQACDSTRRSEYLQYLFNRKHGNLATFEKEVGVPEWDDYRLLANQATIEYVNTKKTFTKYDCVELLLAMPCEWASEEELFRTIMTITRQRRTLFSINAIRDIMIAVGYEHGTQQTKSTMEHAVLRIFRPFNT